ncbi:MAG TPA: hypothetical protein VK203_24730, partial [Nostocaceae cyanobacterium]|nr:hypothetical protein [Nostocaceae cyanobacterium]
MNKNDNNTQQIIENLDNLRQDTRLNRVLSNNTNNYCSLQLWLLELTQTNSTEYRLLYGWVIPSTFSDPDKWHCADGGKKQSIGEHQSYYEFRIAKLVLYHQYLRQTTRFEQHKKRAPGRGSCASACRSCIGPAGTPSA